MIIFFIAENGEVQHSQQKQDLKRTVAKIIYELLIVKFRLKLKKVGKTNRPFRYDPYDCTVKVTNRFKGLDLVDRVPEELWTEIHNIVQEAMTKTIPKKKK